MRWSILSDPPPASGISFSRARETLLQGSIPNLSELRASLVTLRALADAANALDREGAAKRLKDELQAAQALADAVHTVDREKMRAALIAGELVAFVLDDKGEPRALPADGWKLPIDVQESEEFEKHKDYGGFLDSDYVMPDHPLRYGPDTRLPGKPDKHRPVYFEATDFSRWCGFGHHEYLSPGVQAKRSQPKKPLVIAALNNRGIKSKADVGRKYKKLAAEMAPSIEGYGTDANSVNALTTMLKRLTDSDFGMK